MMNTMNWKVCKYVKCIRRECRSQTVFIPSTTLEKSVVEFRISHFEFRISNLA